MNKLLKNFLAVIAIFLLIGGVFALFNTGSFQNTKSIPFSQFATDVSKNKIEKVEVKGEKITATYNSGKKKTTRKESKTSLVDSLKAYGVTEKSIQNLIVDVKEAQGGASAWLFPVLALLLPLLLFGGLFWMLFKGGKKGRGGGPGGGASQMFSFLKAPAKLFQKDQQKEKFDFDDIAGLEEAKEEMQEVIDFLKNPQKFFKMGAEIPRGVLMVGPPGVGKTIIARAVANEANVPFYSIAGSEFIELFVGVGASRTRQLFETAKKNAPTLVFIDELDAIAKSRMPGMGGGHEEREQTLNQILSEMDGFEKDTGVIVLGATNAPQYLDPALLRPGRFDRRIVLNLPDADGREKILNIHCKEKPLAKEVTLREVAERTSGFSGADLKNLANEAAILAAQQNQKKIHQNDFLQSIEKVLLGPERKSHLLSSKEKRVSAYHETGHALLSYALPETEDIRKVSIISRGMAAGYTLASSREETKLKTKSEFISNMAMLLGGYVAEKIKFGEITTGAADDLEKVSKMARNLVTKYGMSSLGPISFGKNESFPFLGVEKQEEKNYSEKVATKIDMEVDKFLKEAEEKAIKTLKKKRKSLDKIAKVLIEKETIEKEEFEKLAGEKPSKPSSSSRQRISKKAASSRKSSK